jgi:hypothetical protein
MRILLIVPPEREDFYSYLSADKKSEYFLLWNEKRSSPQIRLPLIKEEFFWKDYLTPDALLSSIKPDKIVFFEIIDQRQIALIVTANAKGITTFYLEHGAAPDTDIALERLKPSLNFYKQRSGYVMNRFLFNLGEVLRTKYFYFSSVRFLTSIGSIVKFIRLPFNMQWNTPNKTLLKIKFSERIPKYGITFNEANFEEYKLFTGAKSESARYTGLPMFDSYFQPKSNSTEGGVVYIEHPYLESDLFGWNEIHHKKVASTLFRFATQTKTPVLIKLHPRSDLKRWRSYNLQSEFFEVVQQGDFTNQYLSAKIILGYSSSLITGLICAKKNIVLIGWHPKPKIYGADFSKTGLCHTSLNINELFTNMNEWMHNNLIIQQPDLHNNFLKKYNHPFDGMAGSRVIDAIRTL